MNTLYGFVGVTVVSLLSLVGVLFFFINESVLKRWTILLVGLATGALFGDAFLHLIPEALENEMMGEFVPIIILLGIISFFVFERFLSWHHHHGVDAHEGELPLGKMILVSDALHNFIDGVIIAAAFATDTTVGIATTIAVVLHELPQEIGDFGLLIHAGYTRFRALMYNFISALSAVVGYIVASYFVFNDSFIVGVSAFAAGSFIYIAGSDLVPELKNSHITKDSVKSFVGFLMGLVIMYLLLFLE